MQKKFLVLYHIPTHVMDEWQKTDEAERKKQENALMQEWGKWMARNAGVIVGTQSAGKTKLVNTIGVSDVRNGIHMTSIVGADSLDAAAQIFKDHPHWAIPEASIQVMEIKDMG